MQGISGVSLRWLNCKDFAIGLIMYGISVSRFVFPDRQHVGMETDASAKLENTNCHFESRLHLQKLEPV